jgi:hypothetical protein
MIEARNKFLFLEQRNDPQQQASANNCTNQAAEDAVD